MPESGEEGPIGWQPCVAGVVVDFNPHRRQALGLPIAQQLLDLRDHIVLAEGFELAVQANHRNERSTVSLEQRRIDTRAIPAGAGKRLQRQHPQAGKVATALPQRAFMGRRPLALPDIELLIEDGWRGLVTAAQKQRGQCQREPVDKSHET